MNRACIGVKMLFAAKHYRRLRPMMRFAFSAVILLVGACASVDTRPPEQAVSERSVERAELLMRGEFEAAYAYTTPGYRSLESVNDYAGRWLGASMWEEASVAKVSCNGEPAERCQVALRILLQMPQAGLIPTHFQETWVLSKGKWYLFQDVGL